MAESDRGSDEGLRLIDRRRAQRARLDGASAVVKIGDTEVLSNFRDISRTGFAFTTNRLVGEGTQLEFSGHLHSDGDSSVFVACEARIVRCERLSGGVFLVGCYFTVMSEACREAIDDFVAAAYGRS